MLIQELAPSSGPDWDDYVAQHPGATCYHNRAWQSVAERAYRIPSRLLVARSSARGRLLGVLPLFEVRGLVRSHLSNGLFGAYAPILAEDEIAEHELLRKAKRILTQERFPHLLIKTLGALPPETSRGFRLLDSWVIATLKLQADPGASWDGFRDKIRNCIRKAQRNGLECRMGVAQLPHFYDVLAENMHRKGAPIYGYGFMRVLLESFGDNAEVVTLWKDGQAIAGALVLVHRKTAYVPFASARPEALRMSPNNLLYWEIIRYSCGRRLELLDFGRSLKNSGALAFKLGWGVDVLPQPCYVHSRKGAKLELNPNDPKIDWFVNRWKRLPRRMADTLGPVVCRQVAGLL